MRSVQGRNATVPPRRRAVRPGAPNGGHRRRPAGFTLIELGIVIAIIGIIVAFVLAAGAEGVRRAEDRATQGLIAKLDLGVSERLDALMSRSVSPNGAHRYLAAITPPGSTPGSLPLPWGLAGDDRARAIARLDDLKANMPDSFTVDPGNTWYPLNFGGVAYPNPTSTAHDDFLLPIGHMATAYRPERYTDPANKVGPLWPGPGDYESLPATPRNTVLAWRSQATGIYGASWEARAAFNKLLGFPPRGYDAVDNDGNGYIDEFTIDELYAPSNPDRNALFSALQTDVAAKLARHIQSPKTARSEALYALLIEGIGPMGSVFSADEFTDRQVADTDGDGLPEFIDAWGEPIQFYRWPVYYPSPIQKGLRDYSAATEPRETSPYDQNNSLVAPAWWSAQFNGVTAGSYPTPSNRALAVMQHFYSLTTPTGVSATWDRAGTSPRRAYFSRPLIISSGPDQTLGLETYPPPSPVTQAGLDNVRFARPLLSGDPDGFGFDDVSNQTLQLSGGGVQ